MISYNDLLIFIINYIKYSRYNKKFFDIIIKEKYSVIVFSNSLYHVTIFQDQWDYYETISGKPYYLFHISMNETLNKCSSYFWVDKSDLKIFQIPSDFFTYNQASYDFFSSTRSPCKIEKIWKVLKKFQKILNIIKKKLKK